MGTRSKQSLLLTLLLKNTENEKNTCSVNTRKRTPLNGNRRMQTHAFQCMEIVRCKLASSSCPSSASRPRSYSSACTSHALLSYFVSFTYFRLHKTLRYNHFLLHYLQSLLASLKNIVRVVHSCHTILTHHETVHVDK